MEVGQKYINKSKLSKIKPIRGRDSFAYTPAGLKDKKSYCECTQ